MVKFKWLLLLVLFLFAAQPSFAGDHAMLLGTWRLVSYEAENTSDREGRAPHGTKPDGIRNLHIRGAIYGYPDRRRPKSTENRSGSC